jgi:hypothetical protein
LIVFCTLGGIMLLLGLYFMGTYLGSVQLNRAMSRQPSMGEVWGFDRPSPLPIAARIFRYYSGEEPHALNVPTNVLEPPIPLGVLGAVFLAAGCACFFAVNTEIGIAAVATSGIGSWLCSPLWIVFVVKLNAYAGTQDCRAEERMRQEQEDMVPVTHSAAGANTCPGCGRDLEYNVVCCDACGYDLLAEEQVATVMGGAIEHEEDGLPQSSSGEVAVADNFEQIALNMALLHYALEADHADRFPDEDALLVTCGILDTLVHIGDGHFIAKDVGDALLYAKGGMCRLDLVSIPIASTRREQVDKAFGFGADLFLDYTLNIEALCINAVECFVDSDGLSPEDIILTVLDTKDDIARVLHTPKKTLSRNSAAAGVRQLAAAFMDSPEFADLRGEIGLA